jgi:hypothetical protein
MKPRAVPAYSPAFETFWSLWPRKVAKLAAWTSWRAWDCDNVPELLPALRLQLPAFCKRDIEHVPHATTWLNQRRWEDEIAPQNANGAATRDATCGFHQAKWNQGKRAPVHSGACGDCRHWKAANQARESLPETSEQMIKRLGLG